LCEGVYTQPNEPVYKDSCVEFFVSSPETKDYYNFEFNAIGNILAAVGPSRLTAHFCQLKRLEEFRFCPLWAKSLFRKKTGEISWELTVFLPVSLF
jgi:hypothetical protein